MKKTIKSVVLFFATFFILAHTFFPHSHREDYPEAYAVVDTPEEYSFLDLLRIAVTKDIGQGHLENFHISESHEILGDIIFLKYIIPVAFVLGLVLYTCYSRNLFILEQKAAFHAPPCKDISLRAPPYL